MVFKRQGTDISKAGFTIAHMSKDERGATAVEYGLIAALIALAIFGSLAAISSSLNSTYKTVGVELQKIGD
ncbi:Flp family type IVb pilin [Pseudovibrio exalbescens]|uniref:Flp family type IVb pilin n=1 Tax=Pseudovibrio exalbescens TaxID=197461 RepID=UPI003CC7F07E